MKLEVVLIRNKRV